MLMFMGPFAFGMLFRSGDKIPMDSRLAVRATKVLSYASGLGLDVTDRDQATSGADDESRNPPMNPMTEVHE